MNTITNNPFRVIGVLVGSSAKEELKKTQRLKMYIEAEQEPDEDFSFPSLGKLIRTVDTINNATSKLNLNNDRVNAALFWFFNGRPITDEPAFDALKESNPDHAIEIWSKLTSSEEITQRNGSAYQNLSSLKLYKAFNGAVDLQMLEEGLVLKLRFLESDYYEEFIKIITDETYKTTKEELQRLFLKQVQNEIEKSSGITAQKYLEIINKLSFSAKQAYLNEVVQKPVEVVEKKIEESRAKRNANKSNANNVGRDLYQMVQGSLLLVKNILGSSDLKYTSLSDKISDEVLQCGIVYFKHYRDTNTDPSSDTLDLFRKAKLLAIGNVAKQRCQENTDHLQEWIDEKPERDKQNKIKADLDALLDLFEEFDKLPENIVYAKSLITRSKPRLDNIRLVLGSGDELYLKISTRVVSQAQSYIVSEVNESQENLDYKLALDRYGTINKIKLVLKNAWELTLLIGSLDMESDFKRTRYNTNKESLKSLCNQLGVSTGSYSSTGQSPTQPSRTYSSSTTTQEGIPGWLKVVGAIILFIILIKACN